MTAVQSAWRSAAALTLAYFLLGLAWVGSNPPGAAPDEPDHFVKAVALGHFDIGEKYTGPPAGKGLALERNASISRVVRIPARLNPDGLTCMAFKPTHPASCQPRRAAVASGTVEVITPIGAYPPFVYPPAGIAARAAGGPAGAFMLARLVFLLMSTALLFAGAWHLIGWLGRPALLGAFVGLTPMAVFSTSVVSTSGVEIAAAFAVAAVAVVALRRPESLERPGTAAVLALAGSSLALSRQLGAVTLAVFLLVVVLRVGVRPVLRALKDHPPMLAAAAALIASVLAVATWEARYDHPVHTGSPLSTAALRAADDGLIAAVRSGLGVFGWLDSPLPQFGMAAWAMALSVICGLGILFAERRDTWTLVGLVGATLGVAYLVWATVFFPIGAGVQGRHLLPLFILLPLLSGVIIEERLRSPGLRRAGRRLVLLVAGAVAVIQFAALWFNARRYAVGTDGPVWFFGRSRWAPPLGWTPWLILGAAGAAMLYVVIAGCRAVEPPPPPSPAEPADPDVARSASESLTAG